MIRIIKTIYRWFNKTYLKEFKQEQEDWNIKIETKLDMLIDVVVNGNHNPRR